MCRAETMAPSSTLSPSLPGPASAAERAADKGRAGVMVGCPGLSLQAAVSTPVSSFCPTAWIPSHPPPGQKRSCIYLRVSKVGCRVALV